MTDASSSPDPAAVPPPGQQPAWQPPNQPPAAAAAGLDPKIAALLAYGLGWIGGLIMYFTQKEPEVRFHAAQSILTFGPLHALLVLLSFFGGGFFGLGFGGGLGGFFLFSLLSFAVWIASLVLWIFLSIKGYNLQHYKLPVVGDMAEQWAARPA